jgi:hypothetical protein
MNANGLLIISLIVTWLAYKDLYCVEFSTVVHYFMPDNNMLEDKLTSRDKTKLTNLLRDLFKSGWSCFLKT